MPSSAGTAEVGGAGEHVAHHGGEQRTNGDQASDGSGVVGGHWLSGKDLRIITQCKEGFSGCDPGGLAHGLGSEVLGHLRLHVPGLEQGHGNAAQLFNIGAALNSPGLGFQLKLAGKRGLEQDYVGRLRNATNPGPVLAGRQ